MNFTINEKITLLFAVKQRRRNLMEIAKNEIDYLKSMEVDITEHKDITYWVSEINLCTRLMAKIWKY